MGTQIGRSASDDKVTDRLYYGEISSLEILIVGKNIVTAEWIAQFSENCGHQVDFVSTGKDALRKADAKSFDLVLLDIFLPDTKGYELIPELKRAWPEPKIIAMTDSNSRELELKVRKEGVIYYMIKPVNTICLEKIIKYISDKKA